jgi:hypothetical protein
MLPHGALKISRLWALHRGMVAKVIRTGPEIEPVRSLVHWSNRLLKDVRRQRCKQPQMRSST